MQDNTLQLIAKKYQLPFDVVAEAFDLLVLSWEQADDAQLKARISAWRSAHQNHEKAWQKIEKFTEFMHAMPGNDAAIKGLRAADKVKSRRQLLQAFGLFILAGGILPTAYRSQFGQSLFADISTHVGEIKSLDLPDGSALVLNTSTALNYSFNAATRNIKLVSGEFMLTTGADEHSVAGPRPLLVQTDDGIIQPIGTQFTVRRTDGYTSVEVIAGKVKITNHAGQTQLVAAGEFVQFDRKHIKSNPIKLINTHWATGQLVVKQVSLADFIAELSRYRRGIMRVHPDIKKQTLSGTFDLHDIDHTLEVLTQVLPVALNYTTPYWLSIEPVSFFAKNNKKQ